MNVQIEKDIPVPSRYRVNLGKLPLEDMEIGDSIRVDCAPEDTRRVIAAIRVRAHRFSKQTGWKFSASQKGGVVRLWRTE